MKDTMAMILAAGLGMRMRPWTEQRPKPLMPVQGRPLIHYSLWWLKSQGFREVIINTYHLGERMEAELGDGSKFGLRILYSREDMLLGTGGGIRKARKFFGRRRLVVANADTVLETDLGSLMARHSAAGALATLALVEEKEAGIYTPITVDQQLMVRAIGGQPFPLPTDATAGLRNMTFTGLSILEPELVDYLPENRFSHLAADALVPALAAGKKIAGASASGYWKAVDDMSKLREFEADLAAGIFRPAYLPPE